MRSTAELTGSIAKRQSCFFYKLGEVIFDELAICAPSLMSGQIEVNESYFGGHRKGKCGRGAAGKVPIFRLLNRGGKVYVIIISNARSDKLFPLLGTK